MGADSADSVGREQRRDEDRGALSESDVISESCDDSEEAEWRESHFMIVENQMTVENFRNKLFIPRKSHF